MMIKKMFFHAVTPLMKPKMIYSMASIVGNNQEEGPNTDIKTIRSLLKSLSIKDLEVTTVMKARRISSIKVQVVQLRKSSFNVRKKLINVFHISPKFNS